MLKSVEHRQHKGLNNLWENSHQPTRVRERRMRRFKSPGQTQRFLSAFGPIRDHFHPKQHNPFPDYLSMIKIETMINQVLGLNKRAIPAKLFAQLRSR
nr:hypothetical protein [Chroococcidiopsis cubana]